MGIADQIYEDLITPIEGRMKSVVAGLLTDPDDAADAMQNALLYVWKNLRRIHSHPNPHGYILKVCISSSYDVLRRNARRRKREVRTTVEPDIVVRDTASPEYTGHLLSAIRRGITTLPRQQAQAVLLRLMEDEPFDVIGRALGCSTDTARSHVSKGLARLRQYMSDLELSAAEG